MNQNNDEKGDGPLETVEQITDGNTRKDNIIIHVDCDCFYAACERTRESKLQGEPLVIGMGYDTGETHGAVATASYEAREHGVESAMPIEEALTKLSRRETHSEESQETPNTNTAYYRPVDIEFYEQKGERIHELLKEKADVFEPISIDEAYLDATSKTGWEEVQQYITAIKNEVLEKENIPVSIGVAPTKSAAKLASDYNKPNGVKIVKPGRVREFFADIPVSDIHGVGEVTAEKLHKMGIKTGDGLATADPSRLSDRFGSRGREIHQRARGHDPREVSPPENPKSISNESSLGKDGVPAAECRTRLEALCEKVGARVKNKNAFFRTVSVKVVLLPFDVKTRAYSLPGETQSEALIHDVVDDLFSEFHGEEIRKVGVRVSNLSFSSTKQKSLDDWSDHGEKTVAGEIAAQSNKIDVRDEQKELMKYN